MGHLLTAERRNKIAEYIIANGSIKVGELAQMFSVTTETIRKDLIYLDQEGIVKKSHGGAQSSLEVMERPMETRTQEGFDLKSAIAERALTFIEEKSVIFVDAGSTNAYLAKLLYLRKDLTIFTTSLSAATALANSQNRVYMSGGLINPITMSLEGMGATQFLRGIKVDVAFLGSSGFRDHDGPTSIDFTDADVKRAIISNARLNIVLAHSAKARSTAMISYAPWNAIDYLITDEQLEAETEKILSKEVEIIKVAAKKEV